MKVGPKSRLSQANFQAKTLNIHFHTLTGWEHIPDKIERNKIRLKEVDGMYIGLPLLHRLILNSNLLLCMAAKASHPPAYYYTDG